MFDDVEVELRAVEDILPWSKEREILTFLYQERKEWELMQHQARSLRIEFIDEEDWWVSEACNPSVGNRQGIFARRASDSSGKLNH